MVVGLFEKRPFGLVAAALAGTVIASSGSPAIEFHRNVSNLREPMVSEWVVRLAEHTDTLEACGVLCSKYENETAAKHLGRCRSFTRFKTNDGACYGHLDPQWLPLSGVENGKTIADSGVVLWPCLTDFDCSYNGQCGGGVCMCSQGWRGHFCQTLDLVPVDKLKYGFLPRDSRGEDLSSWGGSVLGHRGKWHMWAARMENYCGIGNANPLRVFLQVAAGHVGADRV